MNLAEPDRPHLYGISRYALYTLLMWSLLWVILLLASSALWNINAVLKLRFALPTFFVEDGFNKFTPALLFATIFFVVTTTLYTLWSIARSRQDISTYTLEHKYGTTISTIFVQVIVLWIHAIALSNVYWGAVATTACLAIFSLYSIRFDSVGRVK